MTPQEAHREALALCDRGSFEDAARLAEALIAAVPAEPTYWHLLGLIRAELGQLGEAASAFEEAMQLDPGDANAPFNLGCMHLAMGKPVAARDAFALAIKTDPTHVDARCNLGNTLHRLGAFEEAARELREVIRREPGHHLARLNLAGVLFDQGHLEDALETAQSVLARSPKDSTARALVLQIKLKLCDFSATADYAALRNAPQPALADVPPHTILHLEAAPDRITAYVAAWTKARYASAAPRRFQPRASGKLRIGYFSCNFHDHPGLFLTAGLFRHHDKAEFEVSAYSLGTPQPSTLRDDLVPVFDAFHQMDGLSDAQIAQVAQSHQLDVAIDLDGHTRNARLGVFGHRIAPLQVSFLGFPGPIGAPFIDYIVADAAIMPPHLRPHYPEAVLFMPHTYQPTDRNRPISPRRTTRQDHGLPEGAFVLCCFNNTSKIGSEEFDIWMRAMGNVADSVLWLLSPNRGVQTPLRERAMARGIDAERLIFAGSLPQAEHLERFGHADLFVDTFRYNAHTTASDALWAGVPVLTRRGDTFAARVAASLLLAIDLPELITTSTDAYETLLGDLMRDRAELDAITATLSKNRLSTPLFDTPTFTRHWEEGLKRMQERRRSGASPADIVLTR